MAGFFNDTLILDAFNFITSSGDNNDIVIHGSLIFVIVSNNNDAITGIVSNINYPSSGPLILVVNTHATNNLIIKNNNSSSAAANRILTAAGSDLTIGPLQTAAIGYDSTNLQWHVIKFIG